MSKELVASPLVQTGLDLIPISLIVSFFIVLFGVGIFYGAANLFLCCSRCCGRQHINISLRADLQRSSNILRVLLFRCRNRRIVPINNTTSTSNRDHVDEEIDPEKTK